MGDELLKRSSSSSKLCRKEGSTDLDIDKAKAGLQKVKDELNAALNPKVLERLSGGLDLKTDLQKQSDQHTELLGALE